MRRFLFRGRGRRAAAGRWIGALALLSAGAWVSVQGGEDAPPFAAWLPEETIAVFQAGDPAAKRADLDRTLFRRIVDSPALAPYVAEFDRSRVTLAQRLAAESGLDPAFAVDLVNAPVSLAVLRLEFRPDAAPVPAVALRIHMPRPVPEQAFMEAVERLVNQPAHLQIARERLGRDVPRLTIRQTLPGACGDVAVLTILDETPWKLAVRGPFILLFRGESDRLLETVLRYACQPAGAERATGTLWSKPGYQAAWRGVGAPPGAAFYYFNIRRIQAGIAAMPGAPWVTIWNELGLDSVQDLGVADGYGGEGMRHVAYLHAPGPRSGLLAAVKSKPGAERTVADLPAVGGGAAAGHVDLAGFYEQLPLFLDAVGEVFGIAALGKGGLTEIIRRQQLLGVDIRDVLEALGNDFAYLGGEDGGVLRFDNVDIPRFSALIQTMERQAGAVFRERVVGDRFRVRYLYRTREGGVPATPSYCLLGQRENQRGVMLLAAYPQAIYSQLAPPRPTGRFGADADFGRVLSGLGSGYDMYLYIDNRDNVGRVYNRLLPVLNWWTETGTVPASDGQTVRGAALPGLYMRAHSPLLGADPGLLPPGSTLTPLLFGFGVGVKSDPQGITATGYSPLGVWGGGIWLVDHLLLSNPTAMGVVAKTLVDLNF